MATADGATEKSKTVHDLFTHALKASNIGCLLLHPNTHQNPEQNNVLLTIHVNARRCLDYHQKLLSHSTEDEKNTNMIWKAAKAKSAGESPLQGSIAMVLASYCKGTSEEQPHLNIYSAGQKTMICQTFVQQVKKTMICPMRPPPTPPMKCSRRPSNG